MHTTPEQQSKLPSDQKVQTEDPEMSPDKLLPSYFSQVESVASTSTSPPVFKTKPTNFLSLSTGDNTIRGEFVIDPSIHIPVSMLPPMDNGKTEDDRKNLSLTSKHSSVHADIWLLGPSTEAAGIQKPRRTAIVLTSTHGSIHPQLHTLDGAAPFSLTGRSSHRMTRLALPRSFQGHLLVSTHHGSVSLSDVLVQNATQLSQVENTRRYFIGNFQAQDEDAWEGDQVEVEAHHGSIRLKYVDEVAEPQGKKGLFSRLLGK